MRALAAALFLALPAQAEAPKALADLPPVASLLAQVMEGVGSPEMITDPESGIGHHGALRPSDSRRLSEADLLFWIGPGFSPWLAAPISRIAEDATVVRLSEVEGLVERGFRQAAVFSSGHGGEDHDHDAHEHDDHGEEETHEDPNHKGAGDLHYWLDPVNASAWVKAMAEALAVADPDNAETYAKNAAATTERLAALTERVAARLDGVSPRFIVAHDALRHFEDRFGIEAVAALSDSHASTPGPRRVAEVRAAVRKTEADCLLVEVGSGNRAPIDDIAFIEIDPLGLTLSPGPDLYDRLIEGLAEALVACSAA